jgi:two-component system, OmpR family, response regulator
MSFSTARVSNPAAGAPRLLVVDDEPEIRDVVADCLRRVGYKVEPCGSGVELDAALAIGPADLVVLDVSMPQEDGLSIARRLRASGRTPILMLTSLDSVVDKIVGFEVGADDYLVKPFDLRELLVRVRALLRRAELSEGGQPSGPERNKMVSFGKVFLDTAAHCLVDASGTKVKLTATEYYLLDSFARNPNRVLTRERLLENLPPEDAGRGERAVDVRVTRIRRKVETDPARPLVIRTVRNVGYIYVPPPEAE